MRLHQKRSRPASHQTGEAGFCSSYSYKSRNRSSSESGWWSWNSSSWKDATSASSRGPWCNCFPPRQWVAPPLGFIDAHCHLEAMDSCESLPYLERKTGFGGWSQRPGTSAVGQTRHLLDAQPPEVRAVISNCCDPNDFEWYEGLMEGWNSGEFQDKRLYWTVGVHPYCASDYEAWLVDDPSMSQRMLNLALHPRCVAIGECGLDYCKSSESHEAQRRVFRQICQLAVRSKKALVVHARDAALDTLEILRENVPADWPIHLHGYTGPVDEVEELMASFSGLCVGFCGVLSFREFFSCCSRCAPLWMPDCRFCSGNPECVERDLEGLARAVPLDRVVLETDAPYLTPVPYCLGAGQACQPWMISATADAIARRKNVDVLEILEASNRNTCRLYSLDLSICS